MTNVSGWRRSPPRILALFLLLAQSVIAQGKDDSIGVHGMALLAVGDQLVAAHMPLHGGRHAHQILLRVDTDSAAELRELVRNSPLVSLQPERFSLRALRAGEITAFSARVFRGHFERDGIAAPEPVRFHVTQILLDRPLSAQASGHYRLLRVGRAALLVHEIGATPSFDQIIEVAADADAPSRLNSGSETPLSADNWPASLRRQGVRWKKLLYLETRDFQ